MEEEIKLLMIIVLSLCTWLKLKNWRTYPSPHLKQVRQAREIEMEQQSIENEQDQIDTQALKRAEKTLFPPRTKRQAISTDSQPYRHCIRGTTYQQDPTNSYCNQHQNTNPFFRPERRVLRTNDEILKQVEHLLRDPPPIQPQLPCLPVPMSAEEEEQSTPEGKTNLPKRKNIAKLARFCKKKQPTAKPIISKPLFSRLPIDNTKRKQKRVVLDIDKEIQKRYEEIRVLQRMKKRQQP